MTEEIKAALEAALTLYEQSNKRAMKANTRPQFKIIYEKTHDDIQEAIKFVRQLKTTK